MSTSAGTRPLLRLFVRRDRIRIPVWIVAIVGLAVVSAVSITDVNAPPQQLAEFAAVDGRNPAVVALNGAPSASPPSVAAWSSSYWSSPRSLPALRERRSVSTVARKNPRLMFAVVDDAVVRMCPQSG